MERAATPGGSNACTRARTFSTSSTVVSHRWAISATLGAEIAVLVEVADDLVADAPDQRVLGGEAQLLVEVVGRAS